MKKILTFGITLLFIAMAISSPAEESTFNENDLDIDIFGWGRALVIEIVNNRNKTITCYENSTLDRFFLNFLDDNIYYEFDIVANGKTTLHWYIRGLAQVSITIEGGNTKVTRDELIIFGFAFGF